MSVIGLLVCLAFQAFWTRKCHKMDEMAQQLPVLPDRADPREIKEIRDMLARSAEESAEK